MTKKTKKSPATKKKQTAKKQETTNIKTGKAVANVTKENPDGSFEDKAEQVGEDRMFVDPPCNVGYSAGVTLPFPDNRYSNAKFSVSLHVPCTHDEINETYDFAAEWVDERMQGLIDEFHEA